MSEGSRLESVLRSLGESVDWPTPSTDFPAKVMARIESDPATVAVHRVWLRPAIAAIAVVMVTVVCIVSPSVRQAVADLLGAAGIRIGVVSGETPSTGAELDLGEPLQLDEVEESVDFQPRIPGSEEPGVPDAIYLSAEGQVNMVWDGTPSLPAAGDTGIGLLLTQSAGDGDEQVAEKLLGPQTGLERLTVEGQPGLWIEGAAHTFTLLDPEGNLIEETTRLAANVLLWEAEGVNHRLETTGDLHSALAIAEALQPIP
jgi:hypothetical protein